jgi:hypothetical protein
VRGHTKKERESRTYEKAVRGGAMMSVYVYVLSAELELRSKVRGDVSGRVL